MGLSNEFLDMASKAHTTKSSINKWYHTKLKTHQKKYFLKKNENTTKRMGKKIYKPYIS